MYNSNVTSIGRCVSCSLLLFVDNIDAVMIYSNVELFSSESNILFVTLFTCDEIDQVF